MRTLGMGICLLLGTASVCLRAQSPAKANTGTFADAGRTNEIAGYAVSFPSPQIGISGKPGSTAVLPGTEAKDPTATRSAFAVPSIPEPGVYAGLLGAATFLVVLVQRARRRLA
ncbi:MAG: hypothetical protein U1F61_25580 [Opitutaceae bacterium]